MPKIVTIDEYNRDVDNGTRRYSSGTIVSLLGQHYKMRGDGNILRVRCQRCAFELLDERCTKLACSASIDLPSAVWEEVDPLYVELLKVQNKNK